MKAPAAPALPDERRAAADARALEQRQDVDLALLGRYLVALLDVSK